MRFKDIKEIQDIFRDAVERKEPYTRRDMKVEEFKKLTVVIPVFNEEKTVEALLDCVWQAPIPETMELEVIVVDDCSNDGSLALLESLLDQSPSAFRLLKQERNQGKGAAIRRGFAEASGDIVLVQDADLEYDPQEYPVLLQPILDGRADVVYGSRFMGGGAHRVLFYWHSVGNRFLTMLSNMFTDLNLTDMETCYKVFRREVIQGITLKSNRFGIEPEMTAKIAKQRHRIYEVPISYHGRTYEEGKKIGWKDGVAAIWAILRYNLF